MEMYKFFRSIIEPCNPQRRFMNLVGALVVYHAKKKEQTGYLEYLLLMRKNLLHLPLILTIQLL